MQMHARGQPVLGQAAAAVVRPDHRYQRHAQIGEAFGQVERRGFQRIRLIGDGGEIGGDRRGRRAVPPDQPEQVRAGLQLEDRRDATGGHLVQVVHGGQLATAGPQDRPVHLPKVATR